MLPGYFGFSIGGLRLSSLKLSSGEWLLCQIEAVACIPWPLAVLCNLSLPEGQHSLNVLGILAQHQVLPQATKLLDRERC